MKDSQPAAGDPIALERSGSRGVPWFLVAVVLAALTTSVYWQAGGYPFVYVDDGLYVTENPVVLRGLTWDGVSWVFSTFHASNWHPLTWLSHMADVELFGPSAGWHHRVNVLLHLLNTELLFFVLWRMTGGLLPSAFVAALFGVHPLHVESVAWVAERKDVLSTLFFFLAMGAYLRYVRRPGTGRYLLLVASFALGLLTKPMVVTLPFVLLLLDMWPLGRLGPPGSAPSPPWPAVWRLVREKLPLFALSAASCAVTYLAQARGGSVSSIETIPLAPRVANALVSYVVYLGKAVWPSSLAVFYPHPATIGAGVPAWQAAGALVLLCGASAAAVWQLRRRPYVAVGWFWYVGTLFPVIGLVQAGVQAYADRYTYVPLVGIFLATAWGAAELSAGRRFRTAALGAVGGAALLALAAAAWVQAGAWRDSVTLMSRAAAVTDRNWFALNGLGVSYNREGRNEQAMDCFRQALRIRPDYAEALTNLGVSCNELGRYREAVGYSREALRIKPDYPFAWKNLGFSYTELGDYRQAIDCLREALRLKPDMAEAWNSLGVSCTRLGWHRQAIGYFEEAVRINPGFAESLGNLGAAYNAIGQPERAVAYCREALRIRPGHVEAWIHLGNAYDRMGQYPRAADSYREALRIRPDYAEAWNNLGVSYARSGQRGPAVEAFQAALRIRPDYAAARSNLAAVAGRSGAAREAGTTRPTR